MVEHQKGFECRVTSYTDKNRFFDYWAKDFASINLSTVHAAAKPENAIGSSVFHKDASGNPLYVVRDDDSDDDLCQRISEVYAVLDRLDPTIAFHWLSIRIYLYRVSGLWSTVPF